MGDDTQGVQPQAPQQYGQQPPQGYGPQPPMPRSKGPIWLGLLSLLAGVASFFVGMFPADDYTVRIIFCVVGIVIAGGGLTLGIVSLSKKWRKGLAISGVIVSGFALLFITAMLVLGTIANYQIDARIAQNNAELEERLAKEQAVDDERLANSEWLQVERDSADLDSYVELDAATLDAVVADPEAYQGKEYVLKATMGEPLIHEGFEQQGLCLARSNALPAVGEPSGDTPLIAIADRGGERDCPIVNRLLGLEDGGVPDMDAITSENRIWVSPAGTIPGPYDEDIALFMLVHME